MQRFYSNCLITHSVLFSEVDDRKAFCGNKNTKVWQNKCERDCVDLECVDLECVALECVDLEWGLYSWSVEGKLVWVKTCDNLNSRSICESVKKDGLKQ